jgi:hypothetical protein
LRISPSYNIKTFFWLADQISHYNLVLHTDAPKDLIARRHPNVNVVPLRSKYPGWWSKLELFGPFAKEERDMLFMDLDTVVTGCLEPFMQQAQQRFCPTFTDLIRFNHR